MINHLKNCYPLKGLYYLSKIILGEYRFTKLVRKFPNNFSPQIVNLFHYYDFSSLILNSLVGIFTILNQKLPLEEKKDVLRRISRIHLGLGIQAF
jgi:hypothetical protein